ncbi:MAG: 50S ribosomal protein L4 [Phycisphaeraceae bacterium]
MIEVPVHNSQGTQVGTLQIDEALLGGEVRHGLLKQAFVRIHANNRLGASKTKNRHEVSGSTRKLYKQKHTGNARRGDKKSPILRHGAHAHSKKPHSWRKDMPAKMRRLANRNALLAKVVDNEVKLVESFKFDKPSTKEFSSLLAALKIDRSCLVALSDTRGNEAKSAENAHRVSVTQVDRLNAFDLLNHRYLLVDKATLEGWLGRVAAQVNGGDANTEAE